MNPDTKALNILVTGGSGFVGQRIIKELLEPDSPLTVNRIVNLDIQERSLEHVEYINADITNFELISEHFRGIDVVMHTAAIIDWGTNPEHIVYDINVKGTENIIRACHEHRVKALVYCSSLDAVFEGKPLIEITEDQPYPSKFPNIYCESKCLSEKLVVEANKGHLRTCILRPADIFGEGDPYHIDPILKMAKSGFYVRLGNGKALSQHIYVGNMAAAHLQAAHALLSGNKQIAGNIYFITDGRQNFFKFFDQIVLGSGHKIWPKNFWIPRPIAFAIGALSEITAWLWRPIKHYNPGFSRFAVVYTCTDFTFNSEKAEKDFGYIHKYDPDEAVTRTSQYYQIQK